ncbi:glycosyltransferase family 25 protein [Aestuariibacter salexigens]|uniref:glycosyltransferase family 25 protein n=1 Tax=Aestuariibacter salexigens TaxID=226010 RepID=UPI00042588E2|nr:glycosyltransferase family 25 protein [Aestuariibacter salexigens]
MTVLQSGYDQLNRYFDHAYVLTLKDATDRQQSVKQALQGLDFTFFYGTDKRNMSMQQVIDEGVYDDTRHRQLKRTHRSMMLGEIACALSHRNMWQDMVENGYQRVMIFEDDVLPVEQELARFSELMEQLPEDWQLLMLGYRDEKRPGLKSSLQVALYRLYKKLHISNWQNMHDVLLDEMIMRDYSDDFYRIGKIIGTHAYALTLDTAKAFINFQTPVVLQADRVFNAYRIDHDYKAFAPKRQFFTLSELAEESSIQVR